MTRRVPALILLLSFAVSPLLAQEGRKPLEQLRDEAAASVARMQENYQSFRDEALKSLERARADGSSDRVAKTKADLAEWAGVFHEDLLGIFSKTQSDTLAGHLGEVFAMTGGADLAQGLAALVVPDGPRAMLAAQSLAQFPSVPAEALTPLVTALEAASPELSGALAAEALIALGRQGHPAAARLARRRLIALAPAERVAAVQALALAPGDKKETLPRLIGVAQKDGDDLVREAALLALGAFPDDHEVQRALHEALENETNPRVLSAALTALETAAHRDTSRHYLFAAVSNGDLAMALREQAARTLVQLGDVRGARLLARPLERALQEDPKNLDAMYAVANRYYTLGAWDEAYAAFERGLPLRGAPTGAIQLRLARCKAQAGQYELAMRRLKAAGYKDDLSELANDDAFEAMRKQPKYRKYFFPE